jgi:hypothetical protein
MYRLCLYLVSIQSLFGFVLVLAPPKSHEGPITRSDRLEGVHSCDGADLIEGNLGADSVKGGSDDDAMYE